MGSLPQLSILKGLQTNFKPCLLHRMFESNIENGTIGNKTALIYNDLQNGEKTISYNQLNSNANRLASAILNNIKNINKSKKNNDGDWIIAICMTPSDNLITTLLSVWKTGAAYLPLDINFPSNRIQHIMNEAQPVLVIHDDDVNSELFGMTPSINFTKLLTESMMYNDNNILTRDTLNYHKNNNNNINNINNGYNNNNENNTYTNDEQLALVLYTSGSTGIPKGVRLPHSIILNRLKWQWERFPYSKTEIIGVFKTALTFVDSVSELWGPLLCDMAILIVPKEITRDPERLVSTLEEFKIERLVLVPTLLKSILMYLSLQNNTKYLYNLKTWICSGETLSISLSKEFFDYFEEGVHVLCNFYGSTEIMGDVTYFVCEGKSQLKLLEKVPIGHPVNNTIIYLLDTDYRPVKLGVVGELFVSGLNLAHGYVNNRDIDRFIENPLAFDPIYAKLYKTGDYASIVDGEVIYEGRTDSQIKIRGHRVDLSEVEKNLLSINTIDKGVVLCYHAGEIDQALLAFITVENNSHIQSGLQIESQLKDKLPHYMIPQVIIIESIPLLINGKIDRQSLLKIYESTNNNEDDENIEIDFDYTDISENQLTEAKVLFETIGEIIGRSTRASLNKNSNFYELGGNSLNSIYTVTQLRTKGYFIGITEFIMAKNLGEILMKICEKKQNDFNNSYFDLQSDIDMNLKSVPIAIEDEAVTIDIMTSSFYQKADLERWLKPQILCSDYAETLGAIWTTLVDNGLSFLVKDANGKCLACALNVDARDEPEVTIDNKLIIIFEFLEYLEGPIREKLPPGKNAILHSFMMGTHSELTAQENINVMHFMENEVLKLAKSKNFIGVMTTNTNPLTQQLGSSVYGYQTMLDYQVNKYIAPDGSMPFGKAPNDQRAVVHWRDIRKSPVL